MSAPKLIERATIHLFAGPAALGRVAIGTVARASADDKGPPLPPWCSSAKRKATVSCFISRSVAAEKQLPVAFLPVLRLVVVCATGCPRDSGRNRARSAAAGGHPAGVSQLSV